jgi:hypothetical protein
VGDDAGTKISSLSTSLALFVLKNRRKKQASGAMLITQWRQGSLGGVCTHEAAARCGLDQHATEALLFALAGAGYVRCKVMHYTLTPVARKWLLKSSPQSLYDYMLFNFLNWTWDERFEDFLRTGKPAHIHQEMSHDQWKLYQRAMRSLAGFSAFEVARRIPVPRGALHMHQ